MSHDRRPDKSADHIIAENMMRHRILSGRSRAAVARAIGVHPPQLQKYEEATNRIAASRLMVLSRALNVPVSAFFDGLPTAEAAADDATAAVTADMADGFSTPETQALILAYYAVAQPPVRRSLLRLMRHLAQASDDDAGDVRAAVLASGLALADEPAENEPPENEPSENEPSADEA